MAEPRLAPDGDGRDLPPVIHTPPAGMDAQAGDSVTSIAVERRRYTRERESKPPPLRIRSLRAYLTTFRVIASYMWLRLRARWHSDTWVEHKLRALHLRNARRIERTIIDLQGLFIKVGQLISIMTNFLPEEFRRELEGLQDSVPPRPYKDIEARLREELGRGPDEVFAQFQPQPLASASLGQVHLARLKAGEPWQTRFDPAALKRDLTALGFWDVSFLRSEEARERYFQGRSDDLQAPPRTGISVSCCPAPAAPGDRARSRRSAARAPWRRARGPGGPGSPTARS